MFVDLDHHRPTHYDEILYNDTQSEPSEAIEGPRGLMGAPHVLERNSW